MENIEEHPMENIPEQPSEHAPESQGEGEHAPRDNNQAHEAENADSGRNLSVSPAPPSTQAAGSPAPPSVRAGRSPSSASRSPVPVPGIRRYPTMPTQPKARITSPPAETSRPRGRSLSTNTKGSAEQPRPSRESEDRMMPIPESRAVSPVAESARFVSPGMRRRTNTMRTMGSVRRRGTTSRPALNTGIATGVAGDEQSVNFSLAGSPVVQDVVAANQPYVDPGYTQLNPAYDQPENIRPVWGLAKPLPRVLRPGMVPTRSELKLDAEQGQNAAPEDNPDLEQGRIESTMRLGRISDQLQQTRLRRENTLLQAYDGTSPTSQSQTSGLGRQPSTRIQPFPDLTPQEETEDPVVKQDTQQSSLQAFPDYEYPDDAASATTEKAGEGDLDGDWIGEEIPLKAYEPLEDEIHNLHTHWSVIRVRFREPLAELLAVTVQLTLGFCSDLVITLSKSTAGNEETTDWAWGLASMVGIYIAGGISGAHLNPAISIMLWVYRGFPLRKVPGYVAAQVLGAFIAALISFGIFREGILNYGGADLGTGGTMSAFVTYPRYSYITASTAFFTEFTGAAILAIAVLALGDDTNAPPGAGMSAFIMGLVITVLSMAFGFNTGLAMNPSRDFGPRLALLALGYGGSLFRNAYWVYGPWLATISGALVGGFLYDAAIFVGGESPVNYPRRRMKRAAVKWKRKWGRRLRRVRKIRRPDEYDNQGRFGR
ncbi:hypothetical protein BP6252_09001 [Coleophoma cylindrospora]|uniref:Aquaporin-like protein n=1 Tax=Coleophoma cylindrospora TaxID=1849047 RepID=A0A3D8R0R3_9HELO|nr:hypothetical protein BP6252_09001 [Coleophoma cylindrospora]